MDTLFGLFIDGVLFLIVFVLLPSILGAMTNNSANDEPLENLKLGWFIILVLVVTILVVLFLGVLWDFMLYFIHTQLNNFN